MLCYSVYQQLGVHVHVLYCIRTCRLEKQPAIMQLNMAIYMFLHIFMIMLLNLLHRQ